MESLPVEPSMGLAGAATYDVGKGWLRLCGWDRCGYADHLYRAVLYGGGLLNVLGAAKLFAVVLLMASGSLKQSAPGLIGKWGVGTAYETNQPSGLNTNQESYIESLHLEYAKDHLRVCGKEISIQSIKAESLSEDDFVGRYHFHPEMIGVGTSGIVDVNISSADTAVCGDYGDPGVHVLVGDNKHAVIEVNNDYFPLVRK
jgi:hypothetical protein